MRALAPPFHEDPHEAAPRARGRPELPHEAPLAPGARVVVRLRVARSRKMFAAFDKTAEGLAKDMRREPGKRGGRTPVERQIVLREDSAKHLLGLRVHGLK